MSVARLFLFTALALLAFAGNSVLCRLALLPAVSGSAQGGQLTIDPASFTAVRLLSGAITLIVLVSLIHHKNIRNLLAQSRDLNLTDRLSPLYLFTYAIAFSFAYVSLDTGIGALILFGSVQISMIVYGLTRGHKPKLLEWIGLLLAFLGLLYLVTPTLSSPSFIGFLLMSLAGIAWAAYTVAAKKVTQPLQATCINFVKTLPLVILSLVVYLLMFNSSAVISNKGIVLAIVSGCLASGVGYALWYAVVKFMTTTQAAVLQLLVPIIAAIGGVLFANEEITLHLVISSLLILGGVLCVLLTPKQTTAS